MTVRSMSQSRQRRHEEAQGDGKKEIALVTHPVALRPGRCSPKLEHFAAKAEGQGNGKSKARPENILHHITGVSADGDHFAVRHVDDAHQAEGDRQAKRDHQQNRPKAQAVKNRANKIHERNVVLNDVGGALAGFNHVTGQPGLSSVF
jgi:hypothetical protein